MCTKYGSNLHSDICKKQSNIINKKAFATNFQMPIKNQAKRIRIVCLYAEEDHMLTKC